MRSGSSLRQRVALAGRGSSAELAASLGRRRVASGIRARAPSVMPATIPASWSAILGLVTEEEELDYEDEVLVLGVWAASAQTALSSGQEVQGDRLSSRREFAGSLRRVAEIPWACTRGGCAEDGGSQGGMGIRRVRMLEPVQQSIAPSARRSYEQAWLEFLKSGAVVSGTRWRLFRLDSWPLFREVGGEASGIQAFWNAIGFRWS
ncbi:hypothetical protein NDU88_001705 [Pleurodeles waltl]|uniref:Uncharacterized protein n=1 Tax=Pleurodeles waltl TaxID=8319 RepID=A0AAV7SDG1_PLEWA|nr:hypothetical protein NDU88_001705 [Pleurodeles waltl]